MSKKVFLFILCMCLTFSAGCSKKQESLIVDKGDEPSPPPPVSSEPTPVLYINPLTGLEEIEPDKTTTRPVAIMVNNLKDAQPVQTGLSKADIIYETEVEGGITRLLALYQDISKVEKIGTVRSARYVYVDLAMGHNAIYVHHGQDEKYAGPHLKDTDHFTLSEKNYGARLSNGLASEHTLYAYGDKLWKGLINDGFKTENTTSGNWQNFADNNSPVALGNPANTVTIPFSTSYKTVFKYDSLKGTYTRYFNNTLRTDYYSNASIDVKNVFVLLTSISNYSDNYHRNVSLKSGTGYYIVNGTYTQINWTKGNAKDSFKFTNVDGSPLTVNPGKSWVCIADKSKSKPVFE